MAFAIFENALNYWFVAISFLRIAVGIVTLVIARRALGVERHHNTEIFTKLKLVPGKFFSFIFGFILLVSGFLLLIGLFTQVAALIIGIHCVVMIVLKMVGKFTETESALFFALLGAVCFSLIYFGAGAIALDLPL